MRIVRIVRRATQRRSRATRRNARTSVQEQGRSRAHGARTRSVASSRGATPDRSTRTTRATRQGTARPWFQVVGTIPGPTTTQPTTSPPLRTVIADALRPFGFTGGEGEHDGPYFYSLGGHGFIPKERIDVRVDADARQIGLIDHNHSTESDLVKQVIESIERETASVYGAKVHLMPRKTRWTDCLGP
jgi:hypothetical protein